MDKPNLTSDDIQLQIHADDWRDALRKAAKPLVSAGDIGASYIEDMIQAVEKLGPYIVIAPGLALGHARPSGDVHRPCLSIATLDEPVSFGSATNDPVDIVVVLAAVDDSAHIELLQQIVVFLNQKGSFELLRNARTSEDARKIIESINGGE